MLGSDAALFDAMMRKETYATTGPRMLVRFFGGWDFVEADSKGRLPADVGYMKGVPMGGDLVGADRGKAKAPSFLVAALRDPEGANLDRVQIVKGWLDREAGPQETVVDLHVAESLVEGETEMAVVWRDPDFDPDVLAFYYARVLEVPTPRWNAIDAARYGKSIAGMRVQVQERAYTSPIWYTPAR